MPLPFLIPIAIVLVAASGTGVAAGVDGVDKVSKAHGRQKISRTRHRQAVADFETTRRRADRRVGQYGEFQLRVQRDTLGGFITWLEANERKVKRLDGAKVDGVEVDVPSLPKMKAQVLEGQNLLAGSVSAVVTGIAARQAALVGVRSAATAGTGAAISGLYGAAAESAILAWLGGGTLAAGGGGVALGGTMLTGFGVAPALLLTGLTLNAEGSKALTKARKTEAEATVAIALLERDGQLLLRVMRRVQEMDEVLTGLNDRARASLAHLSAEDFDPEQHVERFMETAQLMRALREVLNTPILNANGDVSSASKSLVIKHKSSN